MVYTVDRFFLWLKNKQNLPKRAFDITLNNDRAVLGEISGRMETMDVKE